MEAQRGKAATKEDRKWRMENGISGFANAQKIVPKMRDFPR